MGKIGKTISFVCFLSRTKTCFEDLDDYHNPEGGPADLRKLSEDRPEVATFNILHRARSWFLAGFLDSATIILRKVTKSFFQNQK